MTTKTETIRALNDELRQNLSIGTALITAGVTDLLNLAMPTLTIPAAAVTMRASALTCIRSKAVAFVPQSLFT